MKSNNYFPKAIKGQNFRGYIKISKAQAIKFIEASGKFEGFIVGNKVNTFHFFEGWHLAARFEATNAQEFNEHLNSFLFYLNAELGNRAAIYLKKAE